MKNIYYLQALSVGVAALLVALLFVPALAAPLLQFGELLWALAAVAAGTAAVLLLRQFWLQKTVLRGAVTAMTLCLQLLWLAVALLAVLIGQYVRWAATVEQQGLSQGVALSVAEQALAAEIGVAQPAQVRLVYVDTVPFPLENPALKFLGETLGFVGQGIINNAQVFGYSIYVRQGFVLDRPKLAHELVHVRQVEQTSFQYITVWHMLDLVLYGYKNSRIEAEAFLANERYR